jgi:serine/threonine protein kinase
LRVGANILVDWDPRENRLFAVLTDFGITRVISKKALLVRAFRVQDVKGASFLYAAPELVERLLGEVNVDISKDPSYEILSRSADIYAFAVVLYELLTRTIPWIGINDVQQLRQLLQQGQRPLVPPGVLGAIQKDRHMRAMFECMQQGWAQSPFQRPPMSTLRNRLIPSDLSATTRRESQINF